MRTMQTDTRAVVLSARNMENYDRLLVLLTEDRGLVTAYAKGVRRMKGTMASATEQLSYSAFQLFSYRERTQVDRAEAETLFFGIRQDVERLALANYFCQLCRELIPEGDTQPGYLHLLMNTLTLLDRGSLPLAQLKAIFELRLLTMSGYMPDLVACSLCGELHEGEIFFAPAAGTVTFGDCASQGREALLPLSPGVFQGMRHIIYSDFGKLFSFRLPQKSLEELEKASEAYLLAQVERMLPALEFYKSTRLTP